MTFELLPLTAEATLEEVGGKALNLMRMARAGLPVPPGFVIPTAAYRAFVAANGLDRVIASALEGPTADDPAALEAASRRIRQAFLQGTKRSLMPPLPAATCTSTLALWLLRSPA